MQTIKIPVPKVPLKLRLDFSVDNEHAEFQRLGCLFKHAPGFLQVLDRRLETLDRLAELTEAQIAGLAKQASNETGRVAVIAVRPILVSIVVEQQAFADRAMTVLFLDEIGPQVSLKRCALLIQTICSEESKKDFTSHFF